MKRDIYLNLHSESYILARGGGGNSCVLALTGRKKSNKKITLSFFLNIGAEVHFHHSK